MKTDRSRWLALYVLCAGMLMIVLDATIVNVALPSIKDDLHFSPNNLSWVVNAYLIAFGGLLLLAGRIGDLVGQRRVFLSGLTVFTVASLACGIAQDQVTLIAARFVQGVGGAFTSAVILGMIVTMFPEPKDMAKAIGVYGFVASGGGSIGLLAGGVLTSAINWHWIFFVNLPVGVATVLLALRFVPNQDGIGRKQGADVPGAALMTGGLMLGVYAILQVERVGWVAFRSLGLAAVAVALIAAFVVRQSRVANPLMPLRLFRSRTVAGGNVVQALAVVGMFGMFFLGALSVGLAFLPVTVVMGAVSLKFGAPIAARFGSTRTMVTGLLIIAAGLVLFAHSPVHGHFVADVMPPMLLLGLGAGLAFPVLMQVAMSGAAPEDSGLASGLVNTTAQVGGAIGLAVLSTLAAERTDGLKTRGHEALSALNSGYHLAYLIAAALTVAAALIAATVLRTNSAEEQQEVSVEAGSPELVNA